MHLQRRRCLGGKGLLLAEAPAGARNGGQGARPAPSERSPQAAGAGLRAGPRRGGPATRSSGCDPVLGLRRDQQGRAAGKSPRAAAVQAAEWKWRKFSHRVSNALSGR